MRLSHRNTIRQRKIKEDLLMAKKDLNKEMQALYFPSSKEPIAVKVPKMKFLMVDGRGDPNTSKDFQEAIGALYSLSYTMKFMLKFGPEKKEHMVMPLEALWWTDEGTDFFSAEKKTWNWTAMMAQPGHVDKELIAKARKELVRKKKVVPGIDKVKLVEWEEGLSAEIMHIGPYSCERPNIEMVHKFIIDSGHRLRGKHHEIYMSDPRRSKPEKLKTVIRQPME
jgi:hypothetical protein